MKKSALSTTLCWLLWWTPAGAQNAVFMTSADRQKVGTGEQFELTFTVSAPDANGITNFRQPDFSQFVLLSGPNQSTSIQFVNGRGSASVSYTFVLYARQTGKYAIGSASVDYKGKTLKTEPIQIEAVQGKTQQPQASAEQQPVLNLEDKIFVRAIPDKQQARQGEQITVTYKLYWSTAITSYDLVKAPTYEGFWTEDFEIPRQPPISVEDYQGKRFQVATIRKTALFATQSGKLKIEPIHLRTIVQVPAKRKSNDPFDMFFNDPFFNRAQTAQYDFKSNPLTLIIEALPPSPAGFSGAVGKFSFLASIDKKSSKAGDAITLRLSVTGTGNVKLLSLPKPTLPSDVESYEPKLSEEISRDGGIIKGKKIAEYILIPRNPGQRTIDPVSFSYFDLDKKQYMSASSARFDIDITAGRDFSAGGGSLVSKEDVRMLGEDIRFLKLSSGEFRNRDESSAGSVWFLGAMALPPMMFVGALLYRKRMEKIYGDMPRLLFQRAGSGAAKRLKNASTLLAQGNTESYHSEVSRALMGYLVHKLQIPPASFSTDEAVMKLEQRRVSAETVAKLRACMERAEFARFAPGADSKTARQDLLQAAKQAINQIESSLSGKS
ncbi:MAG: BatD family protein [Bacteroidota bacterium]